MTPHQTLAVIVRLATLWLFLYGASTIFGQFFYAKNEGVHILLWVPFISLFLLGCLCVLLWAFALFVAKKIFPSTQGESTNPPAFEGWFAVGCSLIGLFALSKAIPALGSYFTINYLGFVLYPGTFSVNPDWRLHVIFNLFQLVFGFWLFLGGKGLSKILLLAKHA